MIQETTLSVVQSYMKMLADPTLPILRLSLAHLQMISRNRLQVLQQVLMAPKTLLASLYDWQCNAGLAESPSGFRRLYMKAQSQEQESHIIVETEEGVLDQVVLGIFDQENEKLKDRIILAYLQYGGENSGGEDLKLLGQEGHTELDEDGALRALRMARLYGELVFSLLKGAGSKAASRRGSDGLASPATTAQSAKQCQFLKCLDSFVMARELLIYKKLKALDVKSCPIAEAITNIVPAIHLYIYKLSLIQLNK